MIPTIKAIGLATLTVALWGLTTPAVGQSFVFNRDFAGLIQFDSPGLAIDLNPATRVPATFDWTANDGSTGTVTISLKLAPAAGTPFLSTWGKGLYMGLIGSGGAEWSLSMTFSRPVDVQINNFETYTWHERSFANTDGSPWVGSFGTNGVPYYGTVDQVASDPAAGIADGLGSRNLTLYGTTSAGSAMGYWYYGRPSPGSEAGWAYGYFQSRGLTSLELGYRIVISNGADANGVQVNVLSSVPEPIGQALAGSIAMASWAALHRWRRGLRKSG